MPTAGHRGSLYYPPLDGSLFIPELVEFNAQHNPDVTFFIYVEPGGNDLVPISHLDFYQACHRAAKKVRPGLAVDKEVVAILANSDTLLYHTVFMGLIFAGLVPFPMSSRNSAAAVINMMEKTKCHRVITTSHSLSSLIDGIKVGFKSEDTKKNQLRIDEIPMLKDLYPSLISGVPNEAFVPYPPPTLRPSQDDILFYLHSSGSTGFPKPIPIRNLSIIHWCICPCILEHIHAPTPIRIGGASFPAFHAMGLVIQLLAPIATLSSVSIYSPTSLHDPLAAPIMPNPKNILDSIVKTKSNALWAMPPFLEQWALSQDAIEILKTLEYVVYGGGPLASKMGDALVDAGVKLCSVYGATEFGPVTHLFRNEKERKFWNWFRFGRNYEVRWVPQDNNTFECQFLTTPIHQLSVENIPDVKGYATSDIFLKHPTIEGLWKIVGRVDDVLILSSGEKTVPNPMENIIVTNPHVSSAVMFGRGRPHVGVLIEPRGNEIDVDDEAQVAEFRNRVWPEVEEANKNSPAFSRIFKEMILVTRSNKPVIRAGKGTVIKKATVQLYEEEINALYDQMESSGISGTNVPLPTTWTAEDVENWLMAHVAAMNTSATVDPDIDLFAQGFDSLSAAFLKNRITGSLGSSSDENIRESASRIDQNIVFSSPSIRQLARSVIDTVLQQNGRGTADMKSDIENMIEKYSVGFGRSARVTHGHSQGPHVVVLTGSTGGLGSYLLSSLIQRKDVSVVYAFNRPSNGTGSSIHRRQENSFEDRGLDVALLQSEKLVYVETDTSQDRLGLDQELYEKLRTSVTVIIHNAWRIDFNLALSSFEPHVRGTRNLIDLALSSPRNPKPRFMFTSSVGTAQNWDKTKGPFPEEAQYDAGVAEGPGYGASKYVCERILLNSKLPASSFRIGQISGGPPRGAWSTSDWLPIIVKSSVGLGAFPEAQGLLSWIPPHAVSNAILDVAFAEGEPPVAVNLVHPRPIPWTALMRPVANAIHERKITSAPLLLVPFSEWLDKVEASAKDTSEENMKRVPAIKILDFMRATTRADVAIRTSGDVSSEVGGFTPFATRVAQRVSRTIRDLEPLSAADAAQWVEYWEAVGMFQ